MKIPEPLYPCGDVDCCMDGKTYRPELMFYSPQWDDWFCVGCWHKGKLLKSDDKGISLAEQLKQTVAVVPVVMPPEFPGWFETVLDGSGCDVFPEDAWRKFVKEHEWRVKL